MRLTETKHGVIVVAHCDDETMWCGGLMARYPGRWSVISCSIPRTDPIRAWKFYDACAMLGVNDARIIPFTEGETLQGLDALDLSKFDAVVSHNEMGEYGHRHHAQVHRFVVERWHEKVVTIGYGSNPVGGEQIMLSPNEMDRKLAALRCYDHISPSDEKPKWRALLDRYGTNFDLSTETYHACA